MAGPRASGRFPLLRHRRLQVDHTTASMKIAARAGIEHRAATGCQHDALARAELGDRLALTMAESRLAFALEDQRYIGTGALLDLVVAVQERKIEHARELFTHRGFTGPHRADQKYVLFADHRAIRRGCGSWREVTPKRR